MSEEQTFRSDIDHRWFKMKSKAYNGEVRRSEKDFDTLQLGLLLAQGPVALTAKSGFKAAHVVAATGGWLGQHANPRFRPGDAQQIVINTVKKTPGDRGQEHCGQPTSPVQLNV